MGQPKGPGWEGFSSILPPEFQEALKDNRSPRPGVLQVARSLRDNPIPTVTASKNRIAEIDIQMKTLQEERDRLDNEDNVRLAVTEACSTICAPARRIPSDVLHEIFQYTLPDYPSPSSSDSPMALSHVSSAWRTVALQAPRLWSKIYLRIKALDQRSVIKYTEVTTSWAERAGTLPVDFNIYVNCKIEHGTNLAYNFSLFLKTITSWSSRISSLGIGGPHWMNVMMQFADIPWDLRNLERLEFLGQRAEGPGEVDADMAVLQGLAPRMTLFQSCGQKLTTLIARQEMSAYLSTFSFLPWHTLTSVVLEERLGQELDLQKLLTLCPRLRLAALTLGGDRGSGPLSGQVVCKVEQLHLEVMTWMVHALPSFFAPTFKFPNLTHLQLDCDEVIKGDDDELEVVSSFPSLSFLRLPPMFSASYIFRFLRNTPQLQVFHLEFSGPATDLNKLLSLMTITDTNHEFLPLLHEFAIHVYEAGVLLDVSILSIFLYSRTQDRPSTHCGLQKFTLTGSFDILTKLPAEMFRIGDATSSLELQIHPSSGWSHSLQEIDLPASSFTHDGYQKLVDHWAYMQ